MGSVYLVPHAFPRPGQVAQVALEPRLGGAQRVRSAGDGGEVEGGRGGLLVARQPPDELGQVGCRRGDAVDAAPRSQTPTPP